MTIRHQGDNGVGHSALRQHTAIAIEMSGWYIDKMTRPIAPLLWKITRLLH